jgi:ketosteroid isomerase-like protein
MSAEENKQLVQTWLDETTRGEWQPFAGALADDVRYTLIGSNSWAGTYVGRETVVRDLWLPLTRRYTAPIRIRPHRLVAEGDLVVVEATGDATTRTGVPYQNTYCMIFRLRDGKIAEATEYMDTELTTAVLGERTS